MQSERLSAAVELAGRFLLTALFLLEGWSKLNAYQAAVRYTAAYGLPGELLPVAIVIELGGGLLVLIGWQTRCAALALAIFCAFTALVFHTKFGDRNQLLHFEKDLALAGAFLILCARGAGAFSLDAVRSLGCPMQRDA